MSVQCYFSKMLKNKNLSFWTAVLPPLGQNHYVWIRSHMYCKKLKCVFVHFFVCVFMNSTREKQHKRKRDEGWSHCWKHYTYFTRVNVMWCVLFCESYFACSSRSLNLGINWQSVKTSSEFVRWCCLFSDGTVVAMVKFKQIHFHTFFPLLTTSCLFTE